jgi:hypothetical protein
MVTRWVDIQCNKFVGPLCPPVPLYWVELGWHNCQHQSCFFGKPRVLLLGVCAVALYDEIRSET